MGGRKIKSVIFDFDGVVADTGRDIAASVQETQKYYGQPVYDYDTIMSFVGHGAKYLIDNTLPALSEEALSAALSWYKAYYEAHPCDRTCLYEGFEELMRTLHERGVSMSIVSNKPEAITKIIVEKLGVAKYFTRVIGPESVTRMKPDPEGLFMCLDAMGAGPEEAVMVGDSYTDIQAGKAAGMHTCAVLYGYGNKEKLKAQNADFSVHASTEMLDILMGFRKMRRIKQQLKDEECAEILKRNTSGVLAVMGDGGYPYAVPLSYVYSDNIIYFHCAKSGHKLDAIKSCDKVSFCVTDQDFVVPGEYTTYFRSVIIFGRASIMQDDSEIRNAIERLAVKYAPNDSADRRNHYIDKEYDAMCMVKIEIEHMTGKEAIELVRKRQ